MDETGSICDYCGEPLVVCPCGRMIHWDRADCPNCGPGPVMPLPVPPPEWSHEDFVSWGKYIIAAIENGWEEDLEGAIDQFTERYGRRDCAEFDECEPDPCGDDPDC